MDLRAMLLRGRPEPMDLVSVNGRPFAVYASLGLGAENSKFMHRTRRVFGPLRRRLPMLMTPLFMVRTILFDTRYRRRLRIDLDGSVRELATPGIYVANQAHLSGNLDLGWQREADDHRFLAVTLADLGRLGLLRLVYTLQTSTAPLGRGGAPRDAARPAPGHRVGGRRRPSRPSATASRWWTRPGWNSRCCPARSRSTAEAAPHEAAVGHGLSHPHPVPAGHEARQRRA